MPAPDGVLSPGSFSISRQLGFSVLFQTPANAVVDKTDKLNAVLMSLAFWFFVATAIPAALLYKDEYYAGGKVTPTYPTTVKVFCIALIANGVPSLFPTGYCILICNIFKAKVIANQVWNLPLVIASILFYSASFEGYALFMWAIGWSVAMFTVTARGSYLDHLTWIHPKLASVPLAYIAAGAFILATPLLASLENMVDAQSTAFYTTFAAASWFLGFMMWSSMEGWAHVHQFGLYPDMRVWQFKGPQLMKIPLEKEVPGAWNGNTPAKTAASSLL